MRGLGALVVVFAAVLSAGCTDEPDAEPNTTATTATSVTTVTTVTTLPPAVEAPAPTSTTPPTGGEAPSTSAPAVVPEGYERVRATLTEADGSVCELCLWLADTAETRRQGLMFVTDLGDADGMAFVYPEPHRGTFWMKNTLLPLSIAFFGPDGSYLDAFDMEPCTADPCRQYPTADDFLVAIETTHGGLTELGMVPGSVLDLTDLPCDG